MVGISTVATVLLGGPIGVVLYTSRPSGLAENRLVNVLLGQCRGEHRPVRALRDPDALPCALHPLHRRHVARPGGRVRPR